MDREKVEGWAAGCCCRREKRESLKASDRRAHVGIWELGPSTQMGNPQKEWGQGQDRLMPIAHEPTFRSPHRLVLRARLTTKVWIESASLHTWPIDRLRNAHTQAFISPCINNAYVFQPAPRCVLWVWPPIPLIDLKRMRRTGGDFLMARGMQHWLVGFPFLSPASAHTAHCPLHCPAPAGATLALEWRAADSPL